MNMIAIALCCGHQWFECDAFNGTVAVRTQAHDVRIAETHALRTRKGAQHDDDDNCNKTFREENTFSDEFMCGNKV